MPPHTPKTERVVIVRTDTRGNVLGYDVVEQPVEEEALERRSVVYRSARRPKSKQGEWVETYEDDLQVVDEDEDIEYEEAKPDSAPMVLVPVRKAHRDRDRDPSTRKSTPRRVRYVRPKSTFKIFREKLEWEGETKVDTRNDDAMQRIRSSPKKKVFDEQLAWKVRARIETHNNNYIEPSRRPSAKTQVFHDPMVWDADPKIDTHNEEVVDRILRAPKPQIFDEKTRWNAEMKIDTRNEEAVKRLKSAPRPEIYDEKFSWPAVTRIDHQNEEYLEYKERERLNQREKVLTRSIPSARKIKADRPRIDHLNPDFEEYKKQRETVKLPPITDRKLEWQKRARVIQQNDDYIQRIQQKRSIPQIFREKLKWRTKTPRINARNQEFEEKMKEPSTKKIYNKRTHWKSEPKINAYNDSYDPDYRPKPLHIVNEKLRWHAQTKIDTGLEPEDTDDEYEDSGLAA